MKNLVLSMLALSVCACSSDRSEVDVTKSKTVGKNAARAAAETLSVTIPASIVKQTNVVFRGNASAGVITVDFSVDGFSLGTPVTVATNVNGYFSKTYSFFQSGNGRIMTVKGLSATGAILCTKTYTINVLDVASVFISNVPYFYQKANLILPNTTCQNTSIAGILKYYGIKEGKTAAVAGITPDVITTRFGNQKAQTVPGFAQVFNYYAENLGLTVRDTGYGDGQMTVAQFRAKALTIATTGNPMSVHIYCTSFGHLLNVVGYDGTFYYCNDPYGKWGLGDYGAGTPYVHTPTIGNNIKYPKAAFEDALGDDGYSWTHVYN